MVEQAAHNRCVAGSSPALATRLHDPFQHDRAWQARLPTPPERRTTVAKATDIRPKITLACEECKNRNYITKKNRRNDPDRLEVKKFCPTCNKHTNHKETR